MPRQARLDTPGILQDVIVKGLEGRQVFAEGRDRKHFITRTGDLALEQETDVAKEESLMGVKRETKIIQFSQPRPRLPTSPSLFHIVTHVPPDVTSLFQAGPVSASAVSGGGCEYLDREVHCLVVRRNLIARVLFY
jgi:hypothetical protein